MAYLISDDDLAQAIPDPTREGVVVASFDNFSDNSHTPIKGNARIICDPQITDAYNGQINRV